jgi:hypothetical protein
MQPTPHWFETGTVSFELAKGLPAAFVALAIGLVAAWIAFWQYRVARAKLNLDLFERRIAIYDEVMTFLLESLPGGPQSFLATIERRDEVPFLFGDEVVKYLDQVQQHRDELRQIETQAVANNGVVPPAQIPRHTELTNWFVQQRSSGCRRVFAPYLDFGAWR